MRRSPETRRRTGRRASAGAPDPGDTFARPILELRDTTATYEWSLEELTALHVEMKGPMDAEVAMSAALDATAPTAA